MYAKKLQAHSNAKSGHLKQDPGTSVGWALGTVFTTVLEAKEFAEQLPRRINRVLESLASSQLKLKVEFIDEGAVIDGLQKVANRFTLLGYPGFPIVLFLVAGSLGLWLVVNIVTHDKTPPVRK